MSVVTLTSKGQITLPQSVRRGLGLRAGDKLEFVADEAGGFKLMAQRKQVQALPRPVCRARLASDQCARHE
jgi:AbrB family looped-hinge helix DNA binding protein